MRIYEIVSQYKTIVINSSSEKKKYVNEVWELLEDSYKAIGGFKSHDSPNEMANERGEWILTLNDEDIIQNVIISKFSFGKKMVAIGSLQTPEAKKNIRYLLKKIFSTKNYWSEVSGAPEKIFDNMGIPYIDNEYAEKITKKQILDLDKDGIHYTRYIGGIPMRKALMGYVRI